MPRLQGVDLPPNKPLHISLRYLRGIGPTTSLEVCAKANVDPTRKANDLTDDEKPLMRSREREHLARWGLTPRYAED